MNIKQPMLRALLFWSFVLCFNAQQLCAAQEQIGENTMAPGLQESGDIDGQTDATKPEDGDESDEQFSNKEMTELMTFLGDLKQGKQGGITPELLNVLQSFMLKHQMEIAQRRNNLLLQLPAEAREAIEQFHERYERFALKMNCSYLLAELMMQIDAGLEKVIAQCGPVQEVDESVATCLPFDQARARACEALRAQLPLAHEALSVGGALMTVVQSFNSENPLGSIIRPMGIDTALEQGDAMMDAIKRQFQGEQPAAEGSVVGFDEGMFVMLLEATREVIRLEKLAAEQNDGALLEKLEVFQQMMFGIYQKDGHLVARTLLNYLAPENEAVKGCLAITDDMLARLEQPMPEVSSDAAMAPVPTDPARFWRRELRSYAATLFALDSLLKRCDVSSQEDFNGLFRILAGSYEVADILYGFYLDDAKGVKVPFKRYFKNKLVIPTGLDRRILVPELIRRSLSTGLASWYFFNTRNMLDKAQLFDVIFARKPLTGGVAPQSVFINQVMSVAMAMPTFIGKPRLFMSRMTYFKQNLLKCGLSFLYYHLFYTAMFDSNAFLNPDGKPDQEFVRDENGKVVIKDGKLVLRDVKHEWWPSHNPLFRKHARKTIYRGTQVLIDTIESEVYNAIDPMVSANLDAYTLGVVKPGALLAVWKAFLPMALLQTPHAIMDFHERDFFHQDIFQDKDIVRSDKDIHPDSARFQGYSKPWVYAERTLFHYLIASIGGHLGRKAGQHYRKEILSGLDGAVNLLLKGLNKLWIVSDNTVELYGAFKEQAKRDYEDIAIGIRMLTEQLFDKDNQWRRTYIIPLLMEHGYIDEEYVQDEAIVNKTIVYSALRMLARFNCLTYYEAAKFARSFTKNPAAVKDLIDQIVNAIVSNLVAAGTGFAAEKLAGKAAHGFYDAKGPFLVKKMATT